MNFSLAKKNKYKDKFLGEGTAPLNESLHKLGSNCFITNSPYDIKNLIMNKPKLYRILYDSNIDMYMIGDGSEVIHWTMLKEAYEQGYYANYEEYIDSLGSLYNYFDVGMCGDYNDDKDVDPFLWFIVTSPDKESWVLGDDSFDREYHSPYGNIFTRDCDLKDIELYKVLKVSNNVKNLYDNKELTEKMSTSIKSGDRVKMDFHMKSNNGATGTCKGRLGELCFIEWDDGSKSKEITSYLTKIEDIKEDIHKPTENKFKDENGRWKVTYDLGDELSKLLNPRDGDKATVITADGEKINLVAKYWSKPGFYPGMIWEPQGKTSLMNSFGTNQGTIRSTFYKGVQKVLINDEIDNLTESNELEQRAKKHKKKSKGMGWHMAVNAGDVEKGIEVFNNATSCSSGECSAMGEAVEKRTYYYDGPVYLFDSIYKDVIKMCTDASSRKQALSNIRYRVCDELKIKGLKVKDKFLYEMPDDKETLTCDECGHPLNDMSQCPACEHGEEERYDDLSNLEALSELRRMD